MSLSLNLRNSVSASAILGTASSARVGPWAFNSPRFSPPNYRTAAGANRYELIRLQSPVVRAGTRHKWCMPWFYADFSNPGERSVGNGQTIEAMWSEVNGVMRQITFNGGQTSVAQVDGSWGNWTDELAAPIGPADASFVWIARMTPAGGYRAGGLTIQPQNGEGVDVSAASLVANIGVTPPTATQTKRTTYGPMFMVSDGWAGEAVNLVIGDSIASAGWEENSRTIGARGAVGWAARSLDDNDAVYGRMAFGVIGARGYTTRNYHGGGDGGLGRQIAALLDLGNIPFNRIIDALGVNDINEGSTSFATFQDRCEKAAVYWRSKFGNVPITKCTPVRWAGSSSGGGNGTGYAQAGQGYLNASNGPDPSVYSQVVDWIKSVPAPYCAFVDPWPAVQSATEWLVPSFTATLMTDVLANVTAVVTLNAAPPLGVNLVFQPGGGGSLDFDADYTVVDVQTNGVNFNVTLGRAVAKAHLAGSAVGSAHTGDAGHPTSYASAQMAAYVVANWKQAYSVGLFDPLKLPGLVEMWDADHGITVDGASVAQTWTGRVGGAVFTKAAVPLGALEPAAALGGLTAFRLDGNSFGGMAPVPASWPINNAPGWIAAFGSQEALAADANLRTIFAYGRETSNRGRVIGRIQSGGANRGRVSTDSNNLVNAVDYYGPVFHIGQWLASSQSQRINGVATAAAAATVATTNTRARYGSRANGTVDQYWVGLVRSLYVGSGELSLANAQRLEAHELWSASLQSLLPAGHPYKQFKP